MYNLFMHLLHLGSTRGPGVKQTMNLVMRDPMSQSSGVVAGNQCGQYTPTRTSKHHPD